MSKVALSGNASGTGTFTIASPNSNTDRTLTLPDNTGTILTTATAGVPVNGPAFSAYQSVSQTLSSGTFTKIQLQAEEFDTASCFDSTTNYRFTPTVAGYYQITGGVGINVGSGGGIVEIYKNGTRYKRGVATSAVGGITLHIEASALVYMNGSTDYVELYGYQNSGGTAPTWDGTEYNYFQAFLARSAT
jgi:hypothetical protein